MKALDKLKRQLAEAEAELEARKKPSEDTGPKFIGEGVVIDEWVNRPTFKYLSQAVFYHFILVFTLDILQKERRERYLARQQVEDLIASI